MAIQTIKAHWKDYNKAFTRHHRNGDVENYIVMQGKTIADRINYFFLKYSTAIYIGACMRFAEVAAKYTPPNIGKANIEEKYYYRPIQELTKLAKGEYPPYHATKADYAALRSGYKFRVLNTKKGHKKNEVYAYCKGINEAKRASKIAMRGLSKYSWGANLNNTKEDVENQINQGVDVQDIDVYRANNLPPIFTRLARKSPAITHYTWGSYQKKIIVNEKDVKKINITIMNRLAEIQRYSKIAIARGLMAAESYIKQIFSGVQVLAEYKGEGPRATTAESKAADKLRSAMGKLFDTDSKSYGIQRLAIERQPKRFDPSQPWNLEINLPHTKGT